MRTSLVILAVAIAFLPTSSLGDPVTPMFVADSSRHLLTVDVTTGQVDLVGASGVQLSDIAFDHDGRLFGVNYSYLYEIDPTTGDSALIGAHGFGGFGNRYGIDALTFDDDGILYAAGNDILISVDPATGVGTEIGTLSQYQSSGDLAVDAAGRLLLTTDIGDLVEVHRDGSGATLIGSIPNVDVYAFAGSADGTLFGIRSTDAIVIIDADDGHATTVSTLEADFPIGAAWGGSFPDQFVPEPSAALLGLCAATAALRRKRHILLSLST